MVWGWTEEKTLKANGNVWRSLGVADHRGYQSEASVSGSLSTSVSRDRAAAGSLEAGETQCTNTNTDGAGKGSPLLASTHRTIVCSSNLLEHFNTRSYSSPASTPTTVLHQPSRTPPFTPAGSVSSFFLIILTPFSHMTKITGIRLLLDGRGMGMDDKNKCMC